MEQTEPTRAERLALAQAAARRTRCEAFVNYAPTVAGEVISPITLASFTALQATQNGFVTGEGAGLIDIVNFIWIHSPDFGQFRRAEKRRLTRRVVDALSPAFPAINGAVRVLMQFPRLRALRWLARPTGEELAAEAAGEIMRLLYESKGEFPTSDNPGEPLPFAQPAHFLNLFRRELGMSFAETNALPLKQLAQHYRELVHTGSQGKTLMLTAAEAEIWREHLQARPAPAAPANSDAAR